MDETFTLRNMLILYYDENEYQKLREIAEDKDSLPSTWKEWMEGYKRKGKGFEKDGFSPKSAPFNLEEFKQIGLPNTEENRYKFATKQIARKAFTEVFNINPSGSLTPVRRIQVNGVIFGPDVSFQRGISFGGVNFHQYMNNDIAVKEEAGVYVIKGFYK